MSKVIKKIAVAVAVVAAVVFTGGTALLATIGRALVTAAVSIGVSRLIAKRANTPADAGGDGGGRVQLAPATSNKLPIVYGSAFIGGSIIDAMTTENNTNIYYVIALAEHPDQTVGGGYTFDTNNVYYDGKLVQFGSNGLVTGLYTNNADPSSPSAQLDTRVNGFLYIYLFTNGSSSGVNTGGLTAQQILSASNGVERPWDSTKYMTNCAFAIVRVRYNQDAGTTNIGALTVKITNALTNPADCIFDYMYNIRYGCAIPLESIDLDSLDALRTYSNQTITYNTASGSPPTATQARYRINGPLDTAQNCLNNLQFLVDSCDSWLQYSELTGKWRVVMNKGYAQTPNAQTLNQLFAVNSSNLIGGIEISPIDLNETYNEVEVAYPNANIKDQTDYQIINLFDTDPTILSPNEAVNRLNLTLPLVNNAVQAKYIAARRIYQSREDLTITFRLDFSGIQIEAGDVIRVTHEVYNWTDKLFRVSTVAETKDDSGNLFADIQAFEYSNDIYNDIVTDYIPTFNTGPKDPMILTRPGTPFFTNFTRANGLVTGFTVWSYVPEQGQAKAMDFSYGYSNNIGSHTRYKTINISDNTTFPASNIAGNSFTYITVDVNDLPADTYYWSCTARNDKQGNTSLSSNAYVWSGANIQTYDPNTATGGIQGNQIQYNTIVNNNIANYTVVNNKIANNTLILNNFNTNVSIATNIGIATSEIMDSIGNTYTAPEDISVRSNNNSSPSKPFYIIGSDPGSNYVYPVFQNTATTGNGYDTNSTGVWQPGNASATLRYNGDWDFYIVYRVTPTSTIQAGEIFQMNIQLNLVSNVDANVQIYPAASFNSDPNLFVGEDTAMHTIQLYANLPFVYESTFKGFGSNAINQGAFLIRNITDSSNVTCALGKMGIYRGYGQII